MQAIEKFERYNYTVFYSVPGSTTDYAHPVTGVPSEAAAARKFLNAVAPFFEGVQVTRVVKVEP
jgi:hypothetical protein